MPKQILLLIQNNKEKVEELIELSKYLNEGIRKYSKNDISPISNKLPNVSKITKMLNVNVQRFGFQFLNYELLVRHILIKFEQNILIAKIFEGILIKPNQPRLKLQNPWKVNENAYYKDNAH